MDKWKIDPYEDDQTPLFISNDHYVVCEVSCIEDAEQIVREHNAHEALVASAKAWDAMRRDFPEYVRVGTKKAEELERRTDAAHALTDAALALLDGVEHHEFPKAESEASHE